MTTLLYRPFKNKWYSSLRRCYQRFLEENTILFNGEDEKEEEKIRIGDTVALPEHGITITVIAPSTEEIQQYQEDQAEKERVATIVKN